MAEIRRVGITGLLSMLRCRSRVKRAPHGIDYTFKPLLDAGRGHADIGVGRRLRKAKAEIPTSPFRSRYLGNLHRTLQRAGDGPRHVANQTGPGTLGTRRPT